MRRRLTMVRHKSALKASSRVLMSSCLLYLQTS